MEAQLVFPAHSPTSHGAGVGAKRKLARVFGGTFEYIAHAASLRPGPDTPEKLASWPSDMLNRLLGDKPSVKEARFSSLLNSGLVLHTDCTGRMTPEVMMSILGKVLTCRGVPLRPDWLVNWRGSDILEASQAIMKSSCHSPVHIFTDIMERMRSGHARAIQDLRPSKDADLQTRTQCFTRIGSYMKKHRNSIFARDLTSLRCLKHSGRRCLVSFQDPLNVHPRERPLTVVIKGFPCTPFSSFGNHEGLGHPAMEIVHASIHDMAASSFDILGMENSDKFPASMFEDELPSKYTVKSMVFGPEDHDGGG